MPEMLAVEPWAILIAAVSGFLIGGLWYSPVLFFRPWMRAAGLTEAEVEAGSKPKIFAGSLLLLLIAAIELALFLGEDADVAWGLGAGLLTGLSVGCALGVLYLFERRPVTLFFVNAGYWMVTFGVMGTLLVLW